MNGTMGSVLTAPVQAGPNAFPSLLAFLNKLDASKLAYHLSHIREETICVELAVPGERWEVEFFADGRVEVERFRSDGRIADETVLDELFTTFA